MIDYSELISQPLPTQGINPYSGNLRKKATVTYAAYIGGQEVVELGLKRHPREEKSDFEYRKQNSYPLKRTSWATNFLTRTLNNVEYPVKREFGTQNTLADVIKRLPPNGKSWDYRLKEVAKEALLGGISYLFINLQTLGHPQSNDDINRTFEVSVLRINQVSNIVMSPSGYISQCQIGWDNYGSKTIVRYYDSKFEEWQSNNDRDFFLVATGNNPLGIAPLVPLWFEGDIMDCHSLNTPVQDITPIDVYIMNALSQSQNAFGYHNFPIFGLPEPRGTINDFEIGLDTQNKEKKVKMGAAQGFYYNQADGAPIILEPQNLHLDQTIKMIDFLNEEIYNLIGRSLSASHSLASGVSKAFDFSDTNETYRNMHTIIQDLEYQCLFMVSLFIDSSAIREFNLFKEQVQIVHPSNFDPTGGGVWERLFEIQTTKSSILASAPPAVLAEYYKAFWRLALSDSVPNSELNIMLQENFTEEKVNESIQSATDPSPADTGLSNGSATESGSTTANALSDTLSATPTTTDAGTPATTPTSPTY